MVDLAIEFKPISFIIENKTAIQRRNQNGSKNVVDAVHLLFIHLQTAYRLLCDFRSLIDARLQKIYFRFQFSSWCIRALCIFDYEQTREPHTIIGAASKLCF